MSDVPELVDSGADIRGAYRYRLWRTWDVAAPVAGFVMLNPSTADATTSDNTITRCMRFAHGWGMGGIEVVNVFPLRATDPKVLKAHRRPHGDRAHNSDAIKGLVMRSTIVIASWGHHASRAVTSEIEAFLRAHAHVYALGLTKDGIPRHPLMLRRETRPTRWLRRNR